MFPDAFNQHTHAVHVPRHPRSTHAHSSCSPTLSIHTRTQFMFPDTFYQHTHTVHAPRHPQSTHAYSSCSPTPSVHTRTPFLSITALRTPLVTAQISRPYTAGRPDCQKASPRPMKSPRLEMTPQVVAFRQIHESEPTPEAVVLVKALIHKQFPRPYGLGLTVPTSCGWTRPVRTGARGSRVS